MRVSGGLRLVRHGHVVADAQRTLGGVSAFDAAECGSAFDALEEDFQSEPSLQRGVIAPAVFVPSLVGSRSCYLVIFHVNLQGCRV